MRYRTMIAFSLVAVVVAVILLGAVLALRHEPSGAGRAAGTTASAGNVPAGATAAVRLLVSARGRSALTSELNAVLPGGQLFPTGTTFTAARGTWHQAGAYANVTGTLHEPGRRALRAEIGLVHRRGRWLVTFEATA